MKEYKVVLVRQKLVDRCHCTDVGDLDKEVHRVVACNAEEAVAKAKALVLWINRQKELRGQVVELCAIYELHSDGSSHSIPIAALF